MRRIVLAHATDFEGWRAHARSLRAAAVPPDSVDWSLAEPDRNLPPSARPAPPPVAPGHPELRVPRAFLDLARLVILHSDPRRFHLLYGLLWRITRGQSGLLLDLSDPLVRLARDMARAVFRDIHRMQGFLRFRQLAHGSEGGGQLQMYLAWYEPEHYIVQDAAPYFARRFGDTHWAILTPRGCAWSDGEGLRFGPGMARPADMPEDQGGLEDLWRAYYKAAYIPARRNPGLLRSHMPAKYWPNLPEAREIAGLLDGTASGEPAGPGI